MIHEITYDPRSYARTYKPTRNVYNYENHARIMKSPMMYEVLRDLQSTQAAAPFLQLPRHNTRHEANEHAKLMIHLAEVKQT